MYIEKINPVLFLISFCVGAYFCYNKNFDESVEKKPDPNNADKLVYKKKNGECYKYNINKIHFNQRDLT